MVSLSNHEMIHKTYFICGTDTGVGKTVVTGALLAWFNSRGVRAGGFKPLESGCGGPVGARHAVPLQRHVNRKDSLFLKKMGRMPEALDVINPYFFKETLAPGIAAERQKKPVSFPFIKKRLKALQEKYDVTLIEGAGGLLVPVHHLKTNLDLIRYLKCPVIVVARLGLGTLNHTLLTLDHLKKNRVRVAGVILNAVSQPNTIAEKTNPAVLRRYGVNLWGIFPYTRRRTQKNLIQAAKKINLPFKNFSMANFRLAIK